MAKLIYHRSALAFRGVCLAVAAAYFGNGVLNPPPGFAGVVSAAVAGQTVTSAHDASARTYVPAAAWLTSGYGGGMHYKDYQTAQDGSVYYEIEVFARIACAVDFYVLLDDNDNANFTIVEGNRLLAQGNSAGQATGMPVVRATASLTPGLHTLRFQVLSGISLYASYLTVRT